MNRTAFDLAGQVLLAIMGMTGLIAALFFFGPRTRKYTAGVLILVLALSLLPLWMVVAGR